MYIPENSVADTTDNAASPESGLIRSSLLLPPDSQSPSLRCGRAPAYELKFVLSEPQAVELEDRLRGKLSLDPHADPAHDNTYALTTLYCDTPRWDVYHRVGRFRLFKFRVRRYGMSDVVYLERKAKRGRQVRKRRSRIALSGLGLLAQSETSDDRQTAWYQHQLRRQSLAPTSVLSYQRRAYFGAFADGPVRITFDRDIRGALAQAWSFDPSTIMQPLLPGQVVAEFKFHTTMPGLFKAVMYEMQLSPAGSSKYRRCLETMGAAPAGNSAIGQATTA